MANSKIKIKHTITKKEWDKTHKDFKSMIDGVHYVMKLTDKGTALVPVNIEESIKESKFNYNAAEAFAAYMRGEISVEEVNKIAKKLGRSLASKAELKSFLQNKSMQNFMADTYKIPVNLLVKRVKELMRFSEIAEESINEGKHDAMLDKLADIVKGVNFMNVGKELKKNGIRYSFSTSMIPMYKIDKLPIAIVNKKYAAGAEREVGDIAIGLLESVNEVMDKRQAGELLKQLGGNKFIAMTGAKNFTVGPKGAGFKIGKNSKGINYVRIDLDGRDLYNMEFIQLRGGNIKVKSKEEGVYADQLRKVFTQHTGLYTSLGESVNEAKEPYQIYHNSFTHAAEAAMDYAGKRGFEIDENDWQSQVALGGKYSRSRPGIGKTHSFQVGLLKNGKPQRKSLNFQVYGMESGRFELNAYIN